MTKPECAATQKNFDSLVVSHPEIADCLEISFEIGFRIELSRDLDEIIPMSTHIEESSYTLAAQQNGQDDDETVYSALLNTYFGIAF